MINKSKIFASALLAATIAMPAGATIIISSDISLQADSDAGGGVVTDTNSVSQGATINPLGPISVNALATFGGASVETFATASSTWASASEGQVAFDDVGWITSGVSSGSALLTNGLDWEYVFEATVTGLFELDWLISTDAATTDAFGLNGVSFLWSGAGGGDFLNLNTAGSLVRNIVAGQQYTFGLGNQANIGGGLGSRTAFMDAVFDWRLPVSEPSTGALFALVLAGLAVSRRRQGAADK